MFRLPVCPHCKTVYHYKDTKRTLKEKNTVCYHCQKPFRATLFPGILIIGGIVLVLSILTNILLLTRMTSLNLIVLFLSTLIYLGLLYLLIPFFISFKKTDQENQNHQTNKKKVKR